MDRAFTYREGQLHADRGVRDAPAHRVNAELVDVPAVVLESQRVLAVGVLWVVHEAAVEALISGVPDRIAGILTMMATRTDSSCL